MKPLQPVIKWSGSKRTVAAQLREFFLPANTYYEPFVGGGAMILELANIHATINDSNRELIYVYKCLRNKKLFKKLYELCKIHEENHSEEYYYKIRDLDRKKTAYANMTMPEKAARCLYLNKACFNGLYRVSGKGFFNVPSAKREKVKCFDEDNIQALHKYFNKRKPVILCKDFAEAVKTAKLGDFVYFDPPYDVVGEQSFTSYTADGFGREEQTRLRNIIRELTDKGVLVMASNANTPFIQGLYKDFNIHVINAKRMINSKGDGRGDVEEVIITNY